MKDWRHAEGNPCLAEVDDWTGATALCGCTDPQPDPDSPCGFVWREHLPCHIASASRHPEVVKKQSMYDHPHVPTRCLSCHDAIEATP